jgi:hypothetical protein
VLSHDTSKELRPDEIPLIRNARLLQFTAPASLGQQFGLAFDQIGHRRALLGGTLAALTLATGKAQSETAMEQSPINHAPAEPLVWPALAKLPSGIRSFNGHADTVLDVVGQIGAPPSLVIFTEGNHLMVVLGDDITAPFRRGPNHSRNTPISISTISWSRPCLSRSS